VLVISTKSHILFILTSNHVNGTSLTMKLHVAKYICVLNFVILVPDDGSGEPKHVARCCIAYKCCV
jgi:hypothetical protein